jgi:hypothetical protein
MQKSIADLYKDNTEGGDTPRQGGQLPWVQKEPDKKGIPARAGMPFL